jgi:hypothetical protein
MATIKGITGQKLLVDIQTGSIVIWHHICMTGEFNYKVEDKELIKFDMSKINALDEDIESTYEKQALELWNQ